MRLTRDLVGNTKSVLFFLNMHTNTPINYEGVCIVYTKSVKNMSVNNFMRFQIVLHLDFTNGGNVLQQFQRYCRNRMNHLFIEVIMQVLYQVFY